MLESCNIRPGVECSLASKGIEITCQMRYLNQSYELSTVPHEIMNLPMGNGLGIL